MFSLSHELIREMGDELASVTAERDRMREIVEAIAYAMKSGCLFPVPEPKPGAGTEAWVKWGAMRNLHDKFSALKP